MIQVDRVSDTMPCLLALWQKGSEKKKWLLPAFLSAVSLMLGHSVPTQLSLVSFKLLFQHWNSEAMSQSNSMHRPFKRNCLGFQKPSISLHLNPHWFLQPEVMGTSLPGIGTLGYGGLVWDWDTLLLRGDLHS